MAHGRNTIRFPMASALENGKDGIVYLEFANCIYYTKRGLNMNLGGAPWSCYIVILTTNMRGSSCAGLRGCQRRRPLCGNHSPFLSHGLVVRRGTQGPLFFLYGCNVYDYIVVRSWSYVKFEYKLN